jgi:hypothetical protein
LGLATEDWGLTIEKHSKVWTNDYIKYAHFPKGKNLALEDNNFLTISTQPLTDFLYYATISKIQSNMLEKLILNSKCDDWEK